ncbi:hypothetical protein CVE36_13255, partial [Pseudomonas syringae pv. actinidiae]|nr:hypothetical protein [Pseudomonas syringae pv. actinidiae]
QSKQNLATFQACPAIFCVDCRVDAHEIRTFNAAITEVIHSYDWNPFKKMRTRLDNTISDRILLS